MNNAQDLVFRALRGRGYHAVLAGERRDGTAIARVPRRLTRGDMYLHVFPDGTYGDAIRPRSIDNDRSN